MAPTSSTDWVGGSMTTANCTSAESTTAITIAGFVKNPS